MKFLLLLPLFVVASIAVPYVPYMPNGWATADTYDEFLEQLKTADLIGGFKSTDGSRIAGGTEAKKGETPEFCWINVGFYSKSQICGCWIYETQYVVTSARCVVDCSEGMATNITVNFPGLSGKDAIMKIEKIFIPDGATPEAFTAYMASDDGKDGNHRNIASSNVALIRLASVIPKITEMKDTKKAKLDTSSASDDLFLMNHKATEKWRFRACGVGVIGNVGERAKGVVCTDVNLITDPAKCLENYNGMAVTPAPAGDQFCVSWPDRDHNVCVGDFGGPVYAYKYDASTPPKIDVANQEIVCTLVGSPNVRKNAHCLDGHVTFCQKFIGPDAATVMSAPAWAKGVVTREAAGK